MPDREPEACPCFLGLPPEAGSAKAPRVAVLPIPYEATTSYGQGTSRGPRAILEASTQVELYDRRTRTEAGPALGFHTLRALSFEGCDHAAAIAAIHSAAAPLCADRRFLLALGGEHSVTVGLLRAATRSWPDLCIVQVDAHADLRDSWEGSPLSHACAARRALEELEPRDRVQLVQVGIRNISAEGDRFRRRNRARIRTFWSEDLLGRPQGAWLDDLEETVRGREVYLTFDLDGLDPAIMPATGTPEPGGLLWHHAEALVERLAGCARLAAADIVELAPQPGNHAPDFLAAKLGYLIARRALGA
jgi:agmatinase